MEVIVLGKVIAIDGPAGAGKSTISKKLANKLGYKYLDTGAMYRAITWLALKNNIDIKHENRLIALAKQADIEFFPPDDLGNIPIKINGIIVTEKIRQTIIDKNVSFVARISGVRVAMVKLQRQMAKYGNIIVDGRDIGTRVLPDADLKLFITASLEERAQRRYAELKNKGLDVSLKEIREEIIRRDKLDSERKVSPLAKADDALLIDTTNLSREEVVNKIYNMVLGGVTT